MFHEMQGYPNGADDVPWSTDLLVPVTSTRSAGLFNQLDKRAEGCLWVHEGDDRPSRPRPRRFVDHPSAARLHGFERHRAVVDPIGNVVQSLAVLGEVLRDRRISARRGEQLNVGIGDLYERFVDAVGFDDIAV